MKVALVGVGKVGLPLACQLAGRGAEVVACDTSVRVVDAINRGQCPLDEPGLAELMRSLVETGALRATTNTAAAAARSEVVVVIVPALLTASHEADTEAVEAVSSQLGAVLGPGVLVCYETTLPVGGTRRLVPLLERSGLRAGVDFDVVYSPERVKSRLVFKQLPIVPKVVGGLTPRGACRAAAFYEQYVGAPVLNVGSLETAELVKLAGMVYRDVNVALANELAGYAEAVGVDLATVIAAANTDGEAALLVPGTGVGGHCTPVYPYFLIHDSRRRGTPIRLAELSRGINDEQPAHVIDRLECAWTPLRGRHVLILGLAFRPQVKEHTFSPAFRLRDELTQRGAHVALNDPLYNNEEIRAHGFTPGALTGTPVPDAVVLNTAHSAYRAIDFEALAARGLKVVVDGRCLWEAARVRSAGLVYIGVGRPDTLSRSRENQQDDSDRSAPPRA